MIATLGQIVEGYVVIFPKEHYACIGEMPEEAINELIGLKDEFDRRITSKYSRPIHFEHGVAGQTVLHAHLHLIPFPSEKDMLERVSKRFPYNVEISSLVELRTIWKERGVYAYYEKNDKKYAFFTDLHPGHGRDDSASELGVPERGNWRNVPRDLDWILIRKTVQNLKKQD